MKHLLLLLFAAVALLSACGRQTANDLATQEVNRLNSGPQPQYPELTLDQQKAAMRVIEEARRRQRVERLRETTPPADWIQFSYHGLLVDANYDIIEPTPENVARIQESMFSILQQSAREQVINKYGSDLTTTFNEQRFAATDRTAARNIVLGTLLAESDQTLRARYEWRYRLLQGEESANANRQRLLSTVTKDVLKRARIPDDILNPPPPPGAGYVESCRAEGVPIPPDWPNSAWTSQGLLSLVFITEGLDAEVLAYKDASVPGVCYALPRRDSANSIEFLGIICQSDRTGKVCFWDNVTVENIKITGPDITLDIDTIGNGLTLAENCTECHRGDNVFNIHPGTALQLTRPGAPGGPYDTSPEVRYSPMGQAHWTNPPNLTLTAQPAGQLSCTGCHGLPQTSSQYCGSVLSKAAISTMPPSGPARAGWPGLAPINPAFANHIAQLAAVCP